MKPFKYIRRKIIVSKQIGNFNFIETSIKDVVIIEPKKYGDNRGYFMETYKESDFKVNIPMF